MTGARAKRPFGEVKWIFTSPKARRLANRGIMAGMDMVAEAPALRSLPPPRNESPAVICNRRNSWSQPFLDSPDVPR